MSVSAIMSMNYDLLAQQRIGDSCHFVGWTTMSMRPSSLEIILNEIRFRTLDTGFSRPRVLELGSGWSTRHLHCACDAEHFVSVDSDESWTRLVGSGSNATVKHALLEKRGDGTVWYSQEGIREALEYLGSEVDVLIVDGPCGNVCDMARAPALPELRQYLASDAVVFLDDIQREQEQRIAQKWTDDFNMVGRVHQIRGSIAELRFKDGKWHL